MNPNFKCCTRLFMIILLFFISTQYSFGSADSEDTKKISKSAVDTSNHSIRTIDVNNIAMYVMNNGEFAKSYTTDNGLFYPRLIDGKINRDLHLVYASGIWLGAMVNDSLRVMINQFNSD